VQVESRPSARDEFLVSAGKVYMIKVLWNE
jgi:hypothetical protein